MRSCQLGNACRTLVGHQCTVPGCDWARPIEGVLAPPVDHSRGQEWWDRWYLGMAQYVSTASRDPSTKTGAVIVRPDKSIASLGYNGFPRGCDDDPKLYADRETKYARVVHCEMNAILHAREPLNGYTLYTFPFMSCDRCAAHVIQAGIKRAVAPKLADDLALRWADSVARARQLFAEAGVELVELVGPH